MRIAQVSTLSTRVGEVNAGSVETLVWLLARELTGRGHDVTVFAAAGSEIHGEMVATVPGPYGQDNAPDDWHLCEWINLTRAIERSRDFDLVHAHAYLWGIPLERLSAAPLLHTIHVMPDDDTARLRAMSPGSIVSGLSRFQWSRYPTLRPHAIIQSGVDPLQFTFHAEAEDYVCFLGRFIAGKGPLRAIETARLFGMRVVLAGPRNSYFDEMIAPLVDGRSVEYVGFVSGEARNRLIGGARALLYPNRAPEPFGLVLVEAMMCGTPVAAIRIGAVPEILEEGVTGCTAESGGGFPDAVARALRLDRRLVRERALNRFSAAQMAERYLRLYEAICSGHLETPHPARHQDTGGPDL